MSCSPSITGAFRDLLLARGDAVDDAVLRSLVPVSVRAAGDHTANNQVSAIIAELPDRDRRSGRTTGRDPAADGQR